MNYSTFHDLILDAGEFDNFENFLSECGPVGASGKEAFFKIDDAFIQYFQCIFDFAHCRNFSKILELSELSQSAFSRNYRIPLRSVQSWKADVREMPEYVLDFLAFAVFSDICAE